MGTPESKVAMITGDRQGISRAIATLLGQRGATGVMVNRAKASDVAKDISNAAISLSSDVTSDPDCVKVARQQEARSGNVDVLVHTGGIYLVATLDATMQEDWHPVMAVNLDAHSLGAQAIAPDRVVVSLPRKLSATSEPKLTRSNYAN